MNWETIGAKNVQRDKKANNNIKIAETYLQESKQSQLE